MKNISPRLQIGKVIGAALVITLWTGVSSATDAFGQMREANEYEVKAAFLYNFTKFVEWPADAAGGSRTSMSICVVGEDLFGAMLAKTLRDKTVNGNKIVIHLLKPQDSLKGCQIGFISSSARKKLGFILSGLDGSGVLTVGETEGFAAMGGIINFVLEQDRVHLEVNVDAADRAGLKISSKLLSMAKIIRDQDHGRKG